MASSQSSLLLPRAKVSSIGTPVGKGLPPKTVSARGGDKYGTKRFRRPVSDHTRQLMSANAYKRPRTIKGQFIPSGKLSGLPHPDGTTASSEISVPAALTASAPHSRKRSLEVDPSDRHLRSRTTRAMSLFAPSSPSRDSSPEM